MARFNWFCVLSEKVWLLVAEFCGVSRNVMSWWLGTQLWEQFVLDCDFVAWGSSSIDLRRLEASSGQYVLVGCTVIRERIDSVEDGRQKCVFVLCKF